MRLKIPAIPLLQPVQAQAILRREVGTAVSAIVEERATIARQEAHVGVSGILRASIGTRVTLGSDARHLVQGSLFTGAQAPYAEYFAYGTRPHWPPRAPIELWAQRVLGDAKLWYVVARAISRRGTRAHPRFAAAFRITPGEILPRVRAAVDRAARLLTQGRSTG